ncbi:MAG: DUF4760 domain-containing protein [Bacteroidota bacterium]
MDQFDIVFQCVTLLGLILGIVYANRQLKATLNIHRANLIWNQKMATESYLASRISNQTLFELTRHFDCLKTCEPIPLAKINQAFSDHSSLRESCHAYLNSFEGLARGIEAGIYSFDLVQHARRGAILKAFVLFREYIDHMRRTHNPNAWLKFEALVNSLSKSTNTKA